MDNILYVWIKQSRKVPDEFYKPFIWNRVFELVEYQRCKMTTNIKVLLCNPRCSWQRGSNENTNRLLRQYFTKESVLSVDSKTKFQVVARQLTGVLVRL